MQLCYMQCVRIWGKHEDKNDGDWKELQRLNLVLKVPVLIQT